MDDEVRLRTRDELLRSKEVREMIAMRAYEIFENRGREPGHEASDWLQAENEIITLLIEEQDRFAQAQTRMLAAPEPGPSSQKIQNTPEPSAEAAGKKKASDGQKKSKTEDEKKAAKKGDLKSKGGKSAVPKKKKK